MGNVIIQKNASDWTIPGANKDLMKHKGAIRLRGRAPDDTSIQCIAGFFIDSAQIDPLLDGSNGGVAFVDEFMYGGLWDGSRSLIDKTNKIFADGSIHTKSALARLQLQPIAAQINPSAFTLRFPIYIPNVAASGYVANEYTATINGLRRWALYYNGGIPRLEFRTYDSGGLLNTVLASGTFVNATWYEVQITYIYDALVNSGVPRARCRVKRMSDGLNIANGESLTAKVLPTPGIYGGACLRFGAAAAESGAAGYTFSGGLDEARYGYGVYYAGELAYDFTVDAAAPVVFAPQSDTATVTLDSSSNGSVWDMSSIDVDDTDQWNETSAVGEDGWEIRYETSNNATPSTYSAWMQLEDLQAESDPTNRYLHLEIRCNSSDLTSFYPLRWIKVTTNVTPDINTGDAPAFDALVDDESGSSVTLTITPPSDAGYQGTNIFYRLLNASIWTDGGTYVGSGGVQGSKQITGLTDKKRYEFVLYAEFDSDVFSAPSITRRVLVSQGQIQSPAKDIADMLEDGSIGTFGTDMFVNDEPESPNKTITVYSTGGSDPDLGFDDASKTLHNPSVMIRVRGEADEYQEAYDRAQQIKDYLHGKEETTINGMRYLFVFGQGDILRIPRDKNSRPIFSVNFRMKRTPA